MGETSDGDWSETGCLRSRRYHDGQLLGVLSPGSGQVVLTLAQPDGEVFELHAEGVVDLVVDDFRLGNIVGEVWFLPKRLWGPPLGALVAEKFGTRAEGMLLAVICSYGAMVLALCHDVTVRSAGALPGRSPGEG